MPVLVQFGAFVSDSDCVGACVAGVVNSASTGTITKQAMEASNTIAKVMMISAAIDVIHILSSTKISAEDAAEAAAAT